MSLLFRSIDQDKIVIQYLPPGRIYKKAGQAGTNFNKLIQWLAAFFTGTIKEFNTSILALFISRSYLFKPRWGSDYDIPSELFPAVEKENRTDVYVVKYLMRGNTARHFVDIANIYGVGIKMEHGKHAIDALSRLPHDVPHKLLSDTITTYDRVIITLITTRSNNDARVVKIKKILETIKQAHTAIIFDANDSTIKQTYERTVFPVAIQLGI
jgi:hypothetical protein